MGAGEMMGFDEAMRGLWTADTGQEAARARTRGDLLLTPVHDAGLAGPTPAPTARSET